MVEAKDKDKFIKKNGVSYSAGLAFILLASGVPEICLVLQKGGEENEQKDNSTFVEQKSWKVPMGHYDIAKDFNLLDTAIREFEEETAYTLSMNTLSIQGVKAIRVRSDRPGSYFHEDYFYLASSDEMPEKKPDQKTDSVIEKVEFFKLNSLPLKESINGATLAFGHRKKLSLLFSELRDYFESINHDINTVLDQLAPQDKEIKISD